MTETFTADELTLLDEAAIEAVEPIAPPAELRRRIVDAVRQTPQDSRTVRADEGRWLRVIEGVTVKQLSVDDTRGTATILMSLAPGARVPGHDHRGPEDSYVVSGSCHIGPIFLRQGDFHHADGGTHHAEIVSDEGCVLLLVVDKADLLAA